MVGVNVEDEFGIGSGDGDAGRGAEKWATAGFGRDFGSFFKTIFLNCLGKVFENFHF